jgi:hypothetical protein
MSKKKKKAPDPAAATPEELAKWEAEEADRIEVSARNIISSEDVLKAFADEIGKVIAGEVNNAKLLYLVGTSRLFKKPMAAAIKGTSSGGKSELRLRVLAFFPDEAVIAFTTLTERSLLYIKDLRHKILSMGEASGTEEQTLQDYLLRELISEGRLKHLSVQKIGNELMPQTIEKEGPVAFFVTTTRNALHPENETRLLSLEIDDSEKQTRAVLRKVAQVEGLNCIHLVPELGPWQDYQRWLSTTGSRTVLVPFADTLSEIIPAAATRLRRDFGQIIRAIKAHALLHRQHRDIDERGQIVASIERDYAAVRALMNALVAESSGVAVRPGLQETIEAVGLATAAMASEEGASAQAVGKILKLDKSAARRRLLAATSEGFVTNLETRRGQPGRYRLTGQKVEALEILPSPAALLERLPPCHRSGKGQAFEIHKQSVTGGTVAPVAWGTREEDIAAEERAAILEYDAGLSREEAEAQALDEIPELLDRRSARGS